MSGLIKTPPLSVYVHLPWCLAKCPYCDFNSHVAPQLLPQARYIECLLEDLDFDLTWLQDREVQTVFFGGGTPSLFAPESIREFLVGLRGRLPMASDLEVTLEANPGALEYGRFDGYRDAGVTRISLGVQSFNDEHLRRLGRIHQREQVFKAVGDLQAAGFDNFNLDLMYALPEQTIAQALDDLRQAIDLCPSHLSHYQLTLEPGTVFYHRPPSLPSDDLAWDMQAATQALLRDAGYEQYEVSAYATTGRQCRHNLNYWEFGDYVGLGAGAHGKITNTSGEIIRTVRQKQPREYLRGSDQERMTERHVVSASDIPFEFALNALRLRSGFSIDLFESRTGLRRDALESSLEAAVARGLMERKGDHWRPTDLGARFLNDLQTLFLQ